MTLGSVKLGAGLGRPDKGDLTDPRGWLEEFYEKWLATHLRLNWFIEIGHSGPGHSGFTRNLFHLPDTGAGLIASLRRGRNVMASTARYPEPAASRSQARYPLLSLDFDCPGAPRAALSEAARLAWILSRDLGVDPVLVKSGFKGAHLHVPLKAPATYEELLALGNSLARLARPLECGGKPLIDWLSLRDWRRLMRVPYTFNIRGDGKRLALIVDLRLRPVDPRDFEWGRPLDPRVLGVALVESRVPRVRERGPARPKRGWWWVERVLERGLPDGRKRFILYVASRYLVNVRGLALEAALDRLREFLAASCARHGNCGVVYESWIKSVLRGVHAGGFLPWSLATLRSRDPELASLVEGVLSDGGEGKA